jgi:hypothetical protein
MLQETGADIFAFRNAPFQNAGDFFENGQRRGDNVYWDRISRGHVIKHHRSKRSEQSSRKSKHK